MAPGLLPVWQLGYRIDRRFIGFPTNDVCFNSTVAQMSYIMGCEPNGAMPTLAALPLSLEQRILSYEYSGSRGCFILYYSNEWCALKSCVA